MKEESVQEKDTDKCCSRWPRLGIELTLARQSDCSKTKAYDWVGILRMVQQAYMVGKTRTISDCSEAEPGTDPRTPVCHNYAAPCFPARMDYSQPSQQIWREKTCPLSENWLRNFSFQTTTGIGWGFIECASAKAHKCINNGWTFIGKFKNAYLTKDPPFLQISNHFFWANKTRTFPRDDQNHFKAWKKI